MADTEKDTDKLDVKRPDLWSVVKWAKGSPVLLAVLAIASGTGGQQVLEQLGQQVQWWQIALAIAGYAVFDLATRILKRLDTIEQRLLQGTARFERLEADVDHLRRAKARERERASKPALRAQPGTP